MASITRSGEYFGSDIEKVVFVSWSFLLYPLPNLNHLLWRCEFARSMWDHVFQEFDFMLALQRDIGSSTGEFLLHPPLREGSFLVSAGVCALLYVLWGERSNKTFRGVEMNLVMFGFQWSFRFPFRLQFWKLFVIIF